MTADISKLRAARDLVARPGGWGQGTLARDDRGRHVCPWDSSAVSWCATGALRSVQAARADIVFFHKANGLPSPGFPMSSIKGWNDAPGRTQAEVVNAFSKAVAAVRADGKKSPLATTSQTTTAILGF